MLGNGRRLRDFRKGERRVMFGSQREEVTGGWRNPRNEGLRDLYWVAGIETRRVRWAKRSIVKKFCQTLVW